MADVENLKRLCRREAKIDRSVCKQMLSWRLKSKEIASEIVFRLKIEIL